MSSMGDHPNLLRKTRRKQKMVQALQSEESKRWFVGSKQWSRQAICCELDQQDMWMQAMGHDWNSL